MKIRIIVAAALTAATVAACSSSGGSGSSGGSPTGGGGTSPSGSFCQQLKSAVHKTGDLQSALSNPQQLGNKLQPIISAFESLKAEAPANVRPSIDDLLTAMQSAKQANPQQLLQKMSQLGPKLEHDFTALARYVGKNCHG